MVVNKPSFAVEIFAQWKAVCSPDIVRTALDSLCENRIEIRVVGGGAIAAKYLGVVIAIGKSVTANERVGVEQAAVFN